MIIQLLSIEIYACVMVYGLCHTFYVHYIIVFSRILWPDRKQFCVYLMCAFNSLSKDNLTGKSWKYASLNLRLSRFSACWRKHHAATTMFQCGDVFSVFPYVSPAKLILIHIFWFYFIFSQVCHSLSDWLNSEMHKAWHISSWLNLILIFSITSSPTRLFCSWCCWSTNIIWQISEAFRE